MRRWRAPGDRAAVYASVFALDRSAAVRMETAALATKLEFALELVTVEPNPFLLGEDSFFEPSFVTAPAYKLPTA